MHRRNFLAAMGMAGAAASLSFPAAGQKAPAPQPRRRGPSTWLFWDLWHLEHADNVRHRQATAQWQRDATFEDPACFGLNSWPTVYRDQKSGRYRMLYSASWKPYRLLVAESPDGRAWKPLPVPEVTPPGGKVAPHHIYTLEHGSGGGVYLDPVADDGYPFKVFVHQQQDPVFRRALADPQHRWHKIAQAEGNKRYLSEEFTLVSRDGLHWEEKLAYHWGLPDWHPEPPLFGFYNKHHRRHMMTVRPGWGDRRVCLQGTDEFKEWSGPALLFQPDPLDDSLLQFYGMPVFPLGNQYVGLLWVFHCSNSQPVQGFNQFVGFLDCQLTYSYDGVHFHRGLREPLIPLNPPGEHGCGSIQPSFLLETEDEIRIYSESSKIQHGRARAARRGREELYAILLHTLRKDGLMYLESGGAWASFTTKPLALFEPELLLNAVAPHGEIRFQLTDMASRPIDGFTFDNCIPFAEKDALNWKLAWKRHDLKEVLNRVVRLQVQFRDAQIYSFRGNFHFLDAQDRWMLDDGQAIDPALFDF